MRILDFIPVALDMNIFLLSERTEEHCAIYAKFVRQKSESNLDDVDLFGSLYSYLILFKIGITSLKNRPRRPEKLTHK